MKSSAIVVFLKSEAGPNGTRRDLTKSGVGIDQQQKEKDILLLAGIEGFGDLLPEFCSRGLGAVGMWGMSDCNIDTESISMNTEKPKAFSLRNQSDVSA